MIGRRREWHPSARKWVDTCAGATPIHPHRSVFFEVDLSLQGFDDLLKILGQRPERCGVAASAIHVQIAPDQFVQRLAAEFRTQAAIEQGIQQVDHELFSGGQACSRR